MTEKEKLIESLRLEVICPAKSRMFLRTRKQSGVLTHGKSNSDEVLTHWEWGALFRKFGLHFEEELQKLVKSEFGDDFTIVFEEFQSYLHSFTSYKIVWSEEARSPHDFRSHGFYGSYIRSVGH
jgi:hypothetical protein